MTMMAEHKEPKDNGSDDAINAAWDAAIRDLNVRLMALDINTAIGKATAEVFGVVAEA